MPINTTHHSFPQPYNGKVWRYMSLPKYISFLQTKSLYFCKIDVLKKSDPYEGAFTKKDLESFKKSPELGKQLKHYKNIMSKKTYVNCWHMNEYESQAMWKLYSSVHDEAVCIQTTYEKLTNSFNNRLEEFNMGFITYIDHNTHQTPLNNLYTFMLYKSKSFEHEREVRIIYSESDKEKLDLYPKGREFPLDDINSNIENICVSPTAKEGFLPLVKDVTQKYEVNVPVSKSSLADYPYL